MLDIIIPVYNSEQGLQRTLASINKNYLDKIKVTVVDDASTTTNYEEVKKDFPFISLYRLEKNSGPGAARNYGLEHSSEPYINFIDADDYYLNEDVFSLVLNKINEEPNIVFFNWGYIINKRIDKIKTNLSGVHGCIFKRDFLNQFNIRFCEEGEGSYANEDIGFINLNRLMIRHLKLNDPNPCKYYLSLKNPISVYNTRDENSITRSKKYNFLYTKNYLGTTINSLHVLNIAYQNNIESELILDYISFLVLLFYWNICSTEEVYPKYSTNAWKSSKIFCDRFLNKYLQENPDNIDYICRFVIKEIINRKAFWPKNKAINVRKFIDDLSKYDEVPEWYKDEWT